MRFRIHFDILRFHISFTFWYQIQCPLYFRTIVSFSGRTLMIKYLFLGSRPLWVYSAHRGRQPIGWEQHQWSCCQPWQTAGWRPGGPRHLPTTNARPAGGPGGPRHLPATGARPTGGPGGPRHLFRQAGWGPGVPRHLPADPARHPCLLRPHWPAPPPGSVADPDPPDPHGFWASRIRIH